MATTFRNILDRLSGIFLQEEMKKENQAFAAQPDRKGLITKLEKYYQSRAELELERWKTAVMIAEDALRPRRYELLRIYHRAIEDDHLLAQVRTARFTVQMGAFKIMLDDRELEDQTDLLARPWFDEYLQLAVDAELYGHSLIEFNPERDGKGEFQNIFLVPREHVRPETGEVTIYIHDEKGLFYREPPVNKYLVEIGRPYDLGLLKVASKTIIRKEYALTDWSRRNEKYGMPFLIVRTQSRNKAELDEKAAMAENFGANAWAILDDSDQIDMLESNQSFAFQSFKDYADWCDNAISILINGQTGTTEEKAFVGSAEVHERILNTYTKARMLRIQNHINYGLLPFLRSHGYPIPEDAYFQFTDLLEKTAPMPDNMDQGNQQPNNPTPEQQQGLKKKLTPSTSPTSAGTTTPNASHTRSIWTSW